MYDKGASNITCYLKATGMWRYLTFHLNHCSLFIFYLRDKRKTTYLLFFGNLSDVLNLSFVIYPIGCQIGQGKASLKLSGAAALPSYRRSGSAALASALAARHSSSVGGTRRAWPAARAAPAPPACSSRTSCARHAAGARSCTKRRRYLTNNIM